MHLIVFVNNFFYAVSNNSLIFVGHKGNYVTRLELIGIGKTKVGIFDGDVENGEIEIGQVTALLKGREIETVAQVMERIIDEYYYFRQDLINQAMEEIPSRRTLR